MSLLNVITTILAKYTEPFAKNILGEYHCGFRKRRSTMDHIFTIRRVLEKYKNIHQLYIDFRQAFENINRQFIYEAMADSEFNLNKFLPSFHSALQPWVSLDLLYNQSPLLSIPHLLSKQISLTEMTLERTYKKVTILNKLSDSFMTDTDSLLSTVPFEHHFGKSS
jgi:hypothetical protein